ncbi:MAG TPA: polynucleotide adenylyltransferase PcnB [Gammaproteobacteria bacterium]|nr:polynucleotide adenylyltransferase PcnB [Gammaproteobacteria bacterium]
MDVIEDSKSSTPRVIPRAEHIISRANISDCALKVLYRLKNAGFEAYLVGGGVRDMLLGREPKDFDVATDARPEEVKKLFRNCVLIGRRFRLAHVRFGPETIEVATFRAQADDDEGNGSEDALVTESGRILRDNVYGTLEADAWRRDFTVNALYYNIRDFSVVDYTGGMEDLRSGALRLIGDPERRYREDPVRMLRAVRFAAKLGFQIQGESETAIFRLGHLLADIPPARLFDEVLKLFLGGMALQTFELLRHYGLFQYLFPATEACLEEEDEGFPRTLVTRALANTDERIAQGKPVTPAFLYAALLWEPLRRAMAGYIEEGASELQAAEIAARDVLDEQLSHTALPKRFSVPMREIWALQLRLIRSKGRRRALTLLEHPRFRAAYDFVLLRAEAGEELAETGRWWTVFQAVEGEARQAMLDKKGAGAGKSRRRRRRRAKSAQQLPAAPPDNP